MSVQVVTGTGTDVGKTVVSAALASLASAAGRSVAVVKLAQTGLAAGLPGDAAEVRRLTGLADVHELARYPDPLAPDTAARRAGQTLLTVSQMLTRIAALGARDLLLVEGSGGLLVKLAPDGAGLAEVASGLHGEMVLVSSAGLGALNQVALTAEALRSRRLQLRGVVVGAWPADPDLACRTNLVDLPVYAGAPLLGVLPEGAARLDRAAFHELALRSLAPELGGRWTPSESDLA